jgi:integrase
MGKRQGECSIRKRADGRWTTAITIDLADGRKKRISITNRDREKVKERLLEVQGQQQKFIPFSSRDWMVGEYLDYWLENVTPHKIRLGTQMQYEGIAKLYIKPALGKKKLAELGVRDVQAAMDNMEQQHQSARNRQKFRQILSSCLSHAMRQELIFRNVAQLVKMPKCNPKPIIPWSIEQAQYFLRHVENDKHYVAYLIFLTYGMRIGEILGLRWSDIDFDGDMFVVRQQTQRLKGEIRALPVKTDASRRNLQLVPALKQALTKHAQKTGIQPAPFNPDAPLSLEGLVITTSIGTPLDAKNFRDREFYKRIEECGLPRIKPHDTRHTAATLLKNMGTPIKDVQEILGHTDVLTTLKIYQHGDKNIQRKALMGIGEILTAGLSEPVLEATSSASVIDRSRCGQPMGSNLNITLEQEKSPLLEVGEQAMWGQHYESHALTS